MEEELDLIPGLPEEIARECLIRVPFDQFGAVRSVCKLWKKEIESPFFHRTRKSAGLARSLVALVQSEPVPTTKNPSSPPIYRLILYEPSTDTWRSVPPIPGLPRGLPLFCQIAAVERHLILIGGWDPHTWAASDAVYVYDFVSATWRRGASMPGPRRSFFACGAAAPVGYRTVVVVAGGHDERKDAMRSATAYDVARDEWVPLPDMERERDECRGVVLRGRFHVIGGYSTENQGRFSRCGEALNTDTWQWGPVEEGVMETGRCPRTCVAGRDGRMYMCDGGHVAVREVNGRWRTVAPLPADVRAALHMVEVGASLLVMGSGSHGGAQVCYVLEEDLRWRKTEVPYEYSGHAQAACCLEI